MARAKDWAPRGPSHPVMRRLAKLAPSIAFVVERTVDPSHIWDGEGPDPREEGYEPHIVDVIARAIVGGEIREGTNHLGGVYEIPDEPDPDIHGYLNQMLEEALDELIETGLPDALHQEAKRASDYLGKLES